MNQNRKDSTLDTLSKREYQTLAIASVLQCAKLIDKIARTGELDRQEVSRLQEPLFALNPRHNSDVFPSPSQYLPGLTLIEALAVSGSLRSLQLPVQYSVGMLRLADAVLASPELATSIRDGIKQVVRDNETSCSQQTEDLALIYKDTLSKLPRPIQIQGKAAALQDLDNAAAIRSLLLAGVRSGVFWRQLGGRRWQLLLARKKLAAAASNLKKHAISNLH